MCHDIWRHVRARNLFGRSTVPGVNSMCGELGSLAECSGPESSCWRLESCTIPFIPHCAIALRSLNKYLAIDTGGMSNLRAVIDAD